MGRMGFDASVQGPFTRCDLLCVRQQFYTCIFVKLFTWCDGLDVICNVLTLKSHIAIAQNRYGTHSCVTSHTSMHRTQRKSHHVNSVINNHTIQFLYIKNRSRTLHRVNELSHGAIVTMTLNFIQSLCCGE